MRTWQLAALILLGSAVVACEPAENEEASSEMAVPQPSEMSAEAEELGQLWRALHGFRSAPEFHRLGFGQASPYKSWAEEVRELDDRAGDTLLTELGIVPGDLRVLADEYMQSNGAETEVSRNQEARFAAVFDPEPAEPSEGRIIMAGTQACRDFDLMAQSMWAMEAEDFVESVDLLDDAGCDYLAGGVVVSAPLEERVFEWQLSDGRRTFLRVSSDAGEVWISQDEIIYN